MQPLLFAVRPLFARVSYALNINSKLLDRGGQDRSGQLRPYNEEDKINHKNCVVANRAVICGALSKHIGVHDGISGTGLFICFS